ADRDDAAVGIPEHARLLVAADLDRRNLALHEAGDRVHLAGDERRRRAGRVDGHHANLVAIELAAFDEGGPLLELGGARRDRDALAFEVRGRTDGGIGQHRDAGRIAPIDAGDRTDVHPLGHAVADDEAIGEAELGRLAGNQLRGAARALAGTEVDVETGL